MEHRRFLFWFVPLLILAIATALSSVVDMPVARWFFYPAGHFYDNAWTTFVFDHGVNAGQIAGAAAALAFLLSYVRKRWKPWRRPALMLVLTMAIGAGFITHTVLKDNWGRPRPKQVIEFGGQQHFRAIYQPNFFHQPEPSKSFPCGHCTMGFFFFAFVFLGWRLHKPWLTTLGYVLALGLGIALAIARMAQGGHFLSDTIVTGIIMWLTAYACDWLLYSEETE